MQIDIRKDRYFKAGTGVICSVILVNSLGNYLKKDGTFISMAMTDSPIEMCNSVREAIGKLKKFYPKAKKVGPLVYEIPDS